MQNKIFLIVIIMSAVRCSEDKKDTRPVASLSDEELSALCAGFFNQACSNADFSGDCDEMCLDCNDSEIPSLIREECTGSTTVADVNECADAAAQSGNEAVATCIGGTGGCMFDVGDRFRGSDCKDGGESEAESESGAESESESEAEAESESEAESEPSGLLCTGAASSEVSSCSELDCPAGTVCVTGLPSANYSCVAIPADCEDGCPSCGCMNPCDRCCGDNGDATTGHYFMECLGCP